MLCAGIKGPCRSQPFQLLAGYDAFERRTVCVNVTAIGSPYLFESQQVEAVFDKNYNQFLPNMTISESYLRAILIKIQMGEGKDNFIPLDCSCRILYWAPSDPEEEMGISISILYCLWILLDKQQESVEMKHVAPASLITTCNDELCFKVFLQTPLIFTFKIKV